MAITYPAEVVKFQVVRPEPEFGSGRKYLWYLALCGAQSMVQHGQLADFNKLVCEAPCSHRPLFQWGICQQLGEISVDPSWDVLTRGQAVKLLGEVYKTSGDSTEYKDVRRWMVTLLHRISDPPFDGSSD